MTEREVYERLRVLAALHKNSTTEVEELAKEVHKMVQAGNEIEKVRSALLGVVYAWESLPTGYYNAEDINEWLRKPMKQAIDVARRELKEQK